MVGIVRAVPLDVRDDAETPIGPLPRAMEGVVLDDLPRADLEALSSLKLWSEVGVPFDESLLVLRVCSDDWIRQFLGSIPVAIGGAAIDSNMLARARARLRRRRARVPAIREDTNTSMTLVA